MKHRKWRELLGLHIHGSEGAEYSSFTSRAIFPPVVGPVEGALRVPVSPCNLPSVPLAGTNNDAKRLRR